MNCKEIREHFQSYIDGEADSEVVVRIQEHLKECRACTSELERLKEVVEGLRSIEELEAPPDLVVRVREKIEKGSLLRRIGYFLFIPWKVKVPVEVLSLGLIFVLFAYVVQFFPHRMEEPMSLRFAESVKLMEEPAEEGYIGREVGKGGTLPEAELEEAAPMVDGFIPKERVAREKVAEVELAPPSLPRRPARVQAMRIAQEVTLACRDRDETLKSIRELVEGLGGEVLAGVSDEEPAADGNIIEVSVSLKNYPALTRGIEELGEVPNAEVVYYEGDRSVALRSVRQGLCQVGAPRAENGDTVRLLKEERRPDSAVGEEPVHVKIRLVTE